MSTPLLIFQLPKRGQACAKKNTNQALPFVGCGDRFHFSLLLF